MTEPTQLALPSTPSPPRSVEAPRSTRDRDRAIAFLMAAADGHQPFVDQAAARLDAGDATYGDSFRWVGVAKLVEELLEEAADLGAWASLAAEALDDKQLDVKASGRLVEALQQVAGYGAKAHRVLADASAPWRPTGSSQVTENTR